MRGLLEALAGRVGGRASALFAGLLDPTLAGATLDALAPLGLGRLRTLLDAPLHYTANATFVQGGDKIDVIPGEIAVGLHGRHLPGHAPEDLIDETRAIVGEDVAFEAWPTISAPQPRTWGRSAPWRASCARMSPARAPSRSRCPA